MNWRDEVKSGFSALLAAFGRNAEWFDLFDVKRTCRVLFNEQTVDILGERQQSDNFEMEFDPDDLPGLSINALISIEGRAFVVKEDPYVSEDGFTRRATLKRSVS